MGDYNNEKIFDGHITCDSGHSWQVRDEILRFHEESEPLELYDQLEIDESLVSKLPDGVDESDLNDLRVALKRFIDGLDRDAYAVSGTMLLFSKLLGHTDKLFVMFSPDENELRMIQEVTAKNGVYDNFYFVRHDGFVLNPATSITRISLFNNEEADLRVYLSDVEQGTVLGKVGSKFLVLG